MGGGSDANEATGGGGALNTEQQHRTTHTCVYQVVAVGLILVNMELYVREDSR